jgi:hypothetical protein
MHAGGILQRQRLVEDQRLAERRFGRYPDDVAVGRRGNAVLRGERAVGRERPQRRGALRRCERGGGEDDDGERRTIRAAGHGCSPSSGWDEENEGSIACRTVVGTMLPLGPCGRRPPARKQPI